MIQQEKNNISDCDTKSFIQLGSNGSCCFYQIEEKINRLKRFDYLQDYRSFSTIQKFLTNYADESTTLLYSGNQVVFVPSIFFDAKIPKKYLQYNSKIIENTFVDYDEISDQGIVVVYTIDLIVNGYEREITHYISRLLRLVFDSLRPSGRHIFVDLQLDFYRLFIIENNKLIFYNSFRFDNKEEFIYYILFTLDQLGLDPVCQMIYRLTNFIGENVLEDHFYHLKPHVGGILSWSLHKQLSLDFELKNKVKKSKILLV